MHTMWKKMKRQHLVVASLGVLAAVSAAPAFALSADVTAALTTAFTNLQTDAGALQALVIPVIIGIMALTLVVKLIKRFGNKI